MKVLDICEDTMKTEYEIGRKKLPTKSYPYIITGKITGRQITLSLERGWLFYRCFDCFASLKLIVARSATNSSAIFICSTKLLMLAVISNCYKKNILIGIFI